MKLPFPFKTTETTSAATSAAASWPWPACVENPRTLSFRDDTNLSEKSNDDDDSAMITRLSSDRLFFEPGRTSSILEEAKTYKENNVSIMEIESNDPVFDFRVSMEEMVEAHGLGDWESLEELLKCYLRVNDKRNHGYIIGAFVDYLLIHLYMAPDNDSSGSAIDEPCSSPSDNVQYSFVLSPLSFSSSSGYSSNSTSPLEYEDEIVTEKHVNSSSSS